MKDYFRLIGILPDDTEEQKRQAHFRTFRKLQGKRHNPSLSLEEKREAELLIDYLRRAQYNPDLPLPSALRHYLPSEPEQPSLDLVSEKPPLPPATRVDTVQSVVEVPSEQINLESFGKAASELAQNILDTPPLRHESEGLQVSLQPEVDMQVEESLGTGYMYSLHPGLFQPEVDMQVEEIHPVVEAVEHTGEIELEPIFENPEPTVPEVAALSNQEKVLRDVINCPECEWEILTETDSYCSGCGKSITKIAVPDELVIYIGDTGSYTKGFQIRNTGLIPVTIDNFEVLEVKAEVQPKEAFILAKGEEKEVLLHVDESLAFGRRSGMLRFRYHGKPHQIPISLKQPPNIWLQFPTVANSRQLHEGFRLLVPMNTTRIDCSVETNSDSSLTIGVITISDDSQTVQTLMKGPIRFDRDHKIDFHLSVSGSGLRTLSVSFEELGVRHFKLEIQCVHVANLTDRVRYLMDKNAIILGSGTTYSEMQLKNEPDGSLGYGRAERIELLGAPDWLKLEPQRLEYLNSGETALIGMSIDSNSPLISSPGLQHVTLKVVYFDPQLECQREHTTSLAFQFVTPRQFDDWVAIDFGTSNTCAAILDGTSFRVLELESGMAESPTCIQFIDVIRQKWECGLKAYSKRFTGSRALNSTAWVFKPLLTHSYDPVPHPFLDINEGRPHFKTVDELITIYVRALLDSLRLYNCIEPRKAVLTFPVTFGKRQRERLAAAFKAAGLEEVVTPVSEPVALAINYAFTHPEILQQPGIFAVFDFGGGTTDLAIFRTDFGQERPTLRLLDIAGIDVGGETITFELARYIYEQLVPVEEHVKFSFPTSFEDLTREHSDLMRENYRHLAEDAERIKRTLYTDRESLEHDLERSLYSGSTPKLFKARLEADKIEKFLRSRIQRAVEALLEMVQGLCRRGILSEPKLDWILLGGNSSRLQLVTEMLAQAVFNGDQRQILMDPENMKTGVMKGALLYAVSPNTLPFPIEEVRHTLPCHVGLLGSGYKFDPIFQRGLIAGLEKSVERRRVSLVGQNQMKLYYYFGHEANPTVINNKKMKPYAFSCREFADKEVDAEFTLLPEGEGIEVRLSLQGHELVHIAPLLGEG